MNGTYRVWAAGLLISGLALAAGCGEDKQEELAPVSIEVRLQGNPGLRQRTSLGVAGTGEAMATSFDEVARVLIDVRLSDSGLLYYTNFELTEVAPNEWQGTVPLLPRNRQLEFEARALGADGVIAFSGETLATLTIDNQDVEIPLAPAQDGQTYPIPRMFKIQYPEEIVGGQEEQVTFTIFGTPGTPIQVQIASAAAPGTPSTDFSPATGTITLTNSVANFMAVYTAPEVGADTTIDYQVTITAANAAAAVAVTTNFRTTVKRRTPGAIAVGTKPSVRFNPMVETLIANGSATPGAVQLVAAVTDDSPAAALVYQWSYTPNDGTATATFTDATVNPATFEGYTVAHQGTIALAVTDEDGGTTTLRYTLVPDQFADAIDHGSVNGLRRMVAGRAHTCVLTGERKVRCWGDNAYGQLGYGNTQDIGDAPTRLPYTAGDVPLGAEPVVQLAAGRDHTCALLESGVVTCWGRNQFGQLGYGRTDNLADGEPVTSFGYVTLGGLATRIAAGGDHSCAVLVGGAVRCWGYNVYGQLGRGNTANVGDNEPVYSAGNVDLGAGVVVKELALGEYHTCALTTAGAVKCWGYNAFGQLGYGNTSTVGDNEQLTNLANVSLTGPVRKIAASDASTCALTQTGAIRCWGDNAYGQLGQSLGAGGSAWGDSSSELPSTLPNDIAVGGQVSDVVGGQDHVCGLLNNGTLKCWGYNGYGQLGTGSTSNLSAPSATPIDLDGVSVYQVVAGHYHTCALRANGTARCWGRGDEGQLGRGSTAVRYTPAGDANLQIFAP